VRQLIWDPLVEHLDGVHTVLVSPDGDLNRLSLAALPGKRPDSYLVEETAIAVIPVPQFLPELMRETAATEEEQPASMLLVGNVAYDLESSALRPSSTAIAAEPERTRSILPYSPRSAVIYGKRVHFPSLQGAAKEVASIQALHADNFPQATRTVLSGNEATKSNVRNAAAGNRFIHMATHGFFASAGQSAGWQTTLQGQMSNSNNSAVSQLTMMLRSQQPVSVHPGVLSGLALAGANEEKPAKNTNPTTFFDDGILTAVEVAELDLGETDLVVLSACDTGLGAVAGGEGVLGLQRAFQVAGTRSVVTSLWGVDDQATRALMERFYENLWKKKMDKLGALREAQLWMLSGRLSGDGARSESPSAEEIRVKPYYWAAFVLSGDWR
jgi:CHAT domain-containing protein